MAGPARPPSARRSADGHPDVPSAHPSASRLLDGPGSGGDAGSDVGKALRVWFDRIPDRIRPVLAFAVILGTVFLLTITSVALAPAGSSVAAWWPAAGVSVAALLWMPGRRRWALGAGLFVVSLVGNLIGDRSLGVSLGFALANLAETVVVTVLLIRAGGARSALASMSGLGRFL